MNTNLVEIDVNSLVEIDGGVNWWYVAGGCAAIVGGVAGGVASGWTGVGTIGAGVAIVGGIAMIAGAF